jgi:hypothetical protein
MAGLDQEPLDIRAYLARSYDDAGRCAPGELSFGEAALQVWTARFGGKVPKETKGEIEPIPEPEPIGLEARIEWLESAVESILATVQVRPPGERPLSAAPKEAEDRESSDG